MFSLFLIILTCIGYYYLHQYYPRDTKEIIYFTIVMILWITFVYLMNFQEQFVYNVFHQIYEVQQKPLYDLSVFRNQSKEKENDFNLMLLQKQGSRCGSCGNFILPKDINYTHLNYIVPIHQGGKSDHSNLQVVCPNCHTVFY